MTTEDFVKKAQLVHGNTYDYKNSEYINSSIKINIICSIHGEFQMLPHNHLKGQGCPICGRLKCDSSRKIGTKKFIEEAIKVHGNYYDYSKVEYVKSRTPIIIICPEHGEFLQNPDKHLKGCGCFKCKTGNSRKQFIEKATKLHNDFYDYSKVDYVNSSTNVEIICPVHGSFWQSPHVHLDISRGHPKGCPECAKKSWGEQLIQELLTEWNYKYQYQYFIKADQILKNSNKVIVDFYLEINGKRVIIEYNGMQHYTYVPYFHRGGLIDFINQTKRDMWLKNYCKKNDILLLSYSYLLDEETLKNRLYKSLKNLE